MNSNPVRRRIKKKQINHGEDGSRLLFDVDEANVGGNYNDERLNIVKANSDSENYEEQVDYQGMKSTVSMAIEIWSGIQKPLVLKSSISLEGMEYLHLKRIPSLNTPSIFSKFIINDGAVKATTNTKPSLYLNFYSNLRSFCLTEQNIKPIVIAPFFNDKSAPSRCSESRSGRQEIEVATGNASNRRLGDVDFVFEQDQLLEANRGRNNHEAEAHLIEGCSLQDVLAWFFLITNFILELPSAVFDQLSTKNHPHYAFIVMLISLIGFMVCIGELIHKAKRETVSWKWGGRVPWFYCPRTDKPFGTLWDIIGFACAFPQCILTAINYSFISRHIDGPIRISALPIIFAFGLLCSKYLEKPTKTRGGNSTAQYGNGIGDLHQVLVQP